jgi:hypothetical protein
MGVLMSDRKPWFLLMTPADANRPDSQWTRQGAASRGKIVATPIAPEGWLVLLGFIALLVVVLLLIWLRGYASGALSTVSAIVTSLVSIGVIVAGFVWIVRARATRLPPAQT